MRDLDVETKVLLDCARAAESARQSVLRTELYLLAWLGFVFSFILRLNALAYDVERCTAAVTGAP